MSIRKTNHSTACAGQRRRPLHTVFWLFVLITGLIPALACGEMREKSIYMSNLDKKEGQQALIIMQMDRFFLFDPDYMKDTVAVFNRHRRLLEMTN
jgi:hypothetical protein